MSHPDDGVIHAWLDGALPPDEAVRVERLVATDAAWGAAAAEARGFVAGASRVLGALDYVPGDVTPRAAAAAAKARRRWWRHPAFAAAATLVLVVGVGRVAWQRGGEGGAPTVVATEAAPQPAAGAPSPAAGARPAPTDAAPAAPATGALGAAAAPMAVRGAAVGDAGAASDVMPAPPSPRTDARDRARLAEAPPSSPRAEVAGAAGVTAKAVEAPVAAAERTAAPGPLALQSVAVTGSDAAQPSREQARAAAPAMVPACLRVTLTQPPREGPAPIETHVVANPRQRDATDSLTLRWTVSGRRLEARVAGADTLRGAAREVDGAAAGMRWDARAVPTACVRP